MTLTRRLRVLLQQERGFTIVELIASMGILMTVMGGLTTMMVTGTKAHLDLNKRFESQTEARLGLDRFRREVHCAKSAATSSTPPQYRVVLTMPVACPTSAPSVNITWCTMPNGANRWDLWRYTGSACSGTGRMIAARLTVADAFLYTAPNGSNAVGTGQLATLRITLTVNSTPTQPQKAYSLQDAIVLRNSKRPA